MIVNGGKYFLREQIAGSSDWTTGSYRYMGAGTSTNTNAGVVGPTGTAGISASGSWQGPANSDFKLSNEVSITRPTVSFSVGNNGYIHVRAVFTDSDFTSGTVSGYELNEFGIFLAESGIPGNSPVDFPTTTNKSDAMLARIVNFYLDDTTDEYKTFTYNKVAGRDLTINFDIIDFGA